MPSWSDREIKSLSVNVITYSLILRIIHVWRVARRSWNSEITARSYAIQPIHCNSEVIKWSNGNSSAINSTWLCHSVWMNACLGPSVFDTVIWPCSSLSCHRKPRSLSLSSPEGVTRAAVSESQPVGLERGRRCCCWLLYALQSRSGRFIEQQQVFLESM